MSFQEAQTRKNDESNTDWDEWAQYKHKMSSVMDIGGDSAGGSQFSGEYPSIEKTLLIMMFNISIYWSMIYR